VSDSRKQPPRCPYCQSTDVVTNPKRPISAYSRCQACGQLWHPDRLPRQTVGRTDR